MYTQNFLTLGAAFCICFLACMHPGAQHCTADLSPLRAHFEAVCWRRLFQVSGTRLINFETEGRILAFLVVLVAVSINATFDWSV